MSYEVEQQQKTIPKDKLGIKIYSPFKIFYDGIGSSLSAANDTGPFDILPGHHNFISLVKPGLIIVRDAKGEQKFEVSRGVLHVKSNSITVFLDV